jgi:putative membrane protein
MNSALTILVIVIAVEHLWFLVLEVFLWRQPTGLRVFRMTKEKAEATAVLAANQGVYNGFLAAGLLWGLTRGALDVQHFFLGCVLVAGVFGGITVSKRIFVIQGLPAAVALVLLWAR